MILPAQIHMELENVLEFPWLLFSDESGDLEEEEEEDDLPDEEENDDEDED